MARRCLAVSYYFPPVGGGGVQRITKLIKYLSRIDWQFTVFCARPGDEQIPKDETLLNEIPESVRVERLESALPGGGKHTRLPVPNYLVRWLSAFLYLPDSRKKWASLVRERIIREASETSYDLILVTSPPYSLARLAGIIQTEVKVPVVLDMRDHWTTYPFKIYPTPYHLWRDRRMEKEMTERVQYGVSVYASLLDHFSEYSGFPSERWCHIPNGYDEEDFQGLSVENIPDSDTFNLAFLGSFYSHINHPHYLFKAIKELADTFPAQAARFCFHHIGQSMIDLVNIADKMGIRKYVKCHGYLSHRKSLELLNGMDALFLTYDPDHPFSGNTIGGKVYEYLRLKKPILVLSRESGEAANLIKSCKAGRVISPNEIDQIAETLYDWIQIRPQYEYIGVEAFRRDRLAEKYAEFLNYVTEDWKCPNSEY